MSDEKCCMNCLYAGNYELKPLFPDMKHLAYIEPQAMMAHMEAGVRCLYCPCAPLKNLKDFCHKFKSKNNEEGGNK